ncbi:hypothetical protein HN51_016020 [Arachis hypogaea]|nr:uncharacterized protein DS421_6g187990 [Arachis hypogaea]
MFRITTDPHRLLRVTTIPNGAVRVPFHRPYWQFLFMLPPPEPKPPRTRRHPCGILAATLARQPNSLGLMVPHHAPLLQRHSSPLRPQNKPPLVNRNKRRRHPSLT